MWRASSMSVSVEVMANGPEPSPTVARLSYVDMAEIADKLGRPLRAMRISVTDRCNLRCPYCMPREAFGSDFQFMDRSELLSFEEITRVVRIMTAAGVSK